ncbi:MAG: hypothetical protein FJ368_06600 [Pelagibacterales bacterium]|nr:hypothetical protein [Pelagibacterales bacterium]
MLKKYLVILLSLNLFCCGFEVIYKDDAKQDNSYSHELAAIRIKKDRNQHDQDLKNSLYDLLNPDYLTIEPKYFLVLKSSRTTSSTFTTGTGSSGRNKILLTVRYELMDLETGKKISEGITTLNDSYTVSTNRFGTYSAEEYLQSNMNKVVAQNIRDSLVNDIIEMRRKKADSIKE